MRTKISVTFKVQGLKHYFLLLGVWCLPLLAQAQGTAFTYQGRLEDGGVPADGNYDLSFAVYNANTAGTLVAGPVTNSAVAVNNGLFAVTLDFGPDVFTGPPLWLELSVSPAGADNFRKLAPRQQLTPAPYAIFAAAAGSAETAGIATNVVSGAVVTSLNGLKDNVVLAAGANITLAPSGNTLTISSTGFGGSVWSLNGTSAYYNAGNVGIGTDVPGGKLEVDAQDAIRLVGYNPFLTLYDSNAGLARSRIQSVGGGLNLFTENYLTGADPFGYVRLDNSGNVGIGSAQPVGKLEVVGQDALRLIGYNPFLTLYDSNAGYARGRIQGVGGGLNFFTENYMTGVNPFGYVRLDNSGNVGIGSAQPVGKLEVVAQDALRLIGYQPFLTLLDSNAGYARSRMQGVGGEIYLETEGYVNGSSPNGWLKLSNSGNVSVGALSIRGGADLAEPFDVADADIAKGSVVVIDPQHPGKLRLSDRPYDQRVAGVISGANGVNPGISLRQEGLLDGGHEVALSGRVYVLADATNGPIEPGDLLTTSDTPGHAMKVTEHGRAQGAILGKAMTNLPQGKGMVLVLVALQ